MWRSGTSSNEETIATAKVLAARPSTSVSKLVAQEIRGLAGEDDSYARARVAALAHLHHGFRLGGALPDRDTSMNR